MTLISHGIVLQKVYFKSFTPSLLNKIYIFVKCDLDFHEVISRKLNEKMPSKIFTSSNSVKMNIFYLKNSCDYFRTALIEKNSFKISTQPILTTCLSIIEKFLSRVLSVAKSVELIFITAFHAIKSFEMQFNY